MERNVITFALTICLTLGFFSLISTYLPANGSKRTPNQLLVKAEPVRLTEVLDALTPAPQETAPPVETETPPFWMESVSAQGVAMPQSQETVVGERAFPLKVYRPLPAALRSSWPKRFLPHPDLGPMIEFWRNVYASYDLHHTILHDTRYLEIVYGVLDFEGEPDKRRRARIESAKRAELKAMLLRFHQEIKPLTEGERLVLRLFENIREQDKFKKAAERIRGQWGQKSRFENGLIVSGRYMPMIEKIFEAQGVPKEIGRLVFVESMFVPRARSKVGAAGPWQFMAATARRHGLVINDIIDERYDPLIAAQAAARLLHHDYQKLQSWPLAINAYNSGAVRLERAKQRLHTRRIHLIIKHYEDRAYQFASRNFYPEFLAAWEAVENHRRYFGALERETPAAFDELSLKHPTSPHRLAAKSATDVEVLKDLNQAYHPEIFGPRGVIPQGYVIRVPSGQRELFASLVDEIHATSPLVRRYAVRRGDTLFGIAKGHRVSLSELQSFNNLVGSQIFPGQLLKIPSTSKTVMLGE